MLMEIRRYTIVPGRRDEFIAWSERDVLPLMEAAGMRIIGQFVDVETATPTSISESSRVATSGIVNTPSSTALKSGSTLCCRWRSRSRRLRGSRQWSRRRGPT